MQYTRVREVVAVDDAEAFLFSGGRAGSSISARSSISAGQDYCCILSVFCFLFSASCSFSSFFFNGGGKKVVVSCSFFGRRDQAFFCCAIIVFCMVIL